MKGKYDENATKVQNMEILLKGIEKKVAELEKEGRRIKDEMRTSLESFGRIACAPSYLAFLNEQDSYLAMLLKLAKQEGDQSRAQRLTDQRTMISTLRASVNIAKGSSPYDSSHLPKMAGC